MDTKQKTSVVPVSMAIPIQDLSMVMFQQLRGTGPSQQLNEQVNGWLEHHNDDNITIVGWLQSDCAYCTTLTIFYRYD